MDIKIDDKISNLVQQLLYFNKSNEKKAKKVKSLITTRMVSKGFPIDRIESLLNSIGASESDQDVDKILSRFHLVNEEVTNEEYYYKVIITIPYVTKNTLKGDLEDLEFHFKTNHTDILKKKIVDNTAPGSLILDIHVILWLKSIKNRHDILDVIEPEYLLVNMRQLKKRNKNKSI